VKEGNFNYKINSARFFNK